MRPGSLIPLAALLLSFFCVNASFVCNSSTTWQSITYQVSNNTAFPSCEYGPYSCDYNATNGATQNLTAVCPSVVIEYICMVSTKSSGDVIPLTEGSLFPNCQYGGYNCSYNPSTAVSMPYNPACPGTATVLVVSSQELPSSSPEPSVVPLVGNSLPKRLIPAVVILALFGAGVISVALAMFSRNRRSQRHSKSDLVPLAMPIPVYLRDSDSLSNAPSLLNSPIEDTSSSKPRASITRPTRPSILQEVDSGITVQAIPPVYDEAWTTSPVSPAEGRHIPHHKL